MANLYELTSNYKYVLDLADELDEQTLKDTLDSIKEPLEEKVDNTARLIKAMENDVKAFKEEETRIKQRRQAIENNIKRIKERLQYDLENNELDKIEGKTFKVSVQNNPVSVKIVDEKMIPKGYFVEQEPKLNKKELLEDMKRGEEIFGAELQQTRSIRIR
ncbi:siphovirus Gp157 family protein [Vagococcus sp. CY52-2]|uniref:siphovirus Gp157 family protein n=1 Tax=Vagococcus sp. CY52-2 TaxID=2925838 RepID=UPI001F58D706|nr:siphovirus Gp157 family protein [Vagococcus sp. CY52-2]UNM90587.1 siphovirus Gp157 family protein [Vagococcus sp. CY52-2]